MNGLPSGQAFRRSLMGDDILLETPDLTKQ